MQEVTNTDALRGGYLDSHNPIATGQTSARVGCRLAEPTDGISEAGEEEVELPGPVASLGVLVALEQVLRGRVLYWRPARLGITTHTGQDHCIRVICSRGLWG